MSSYSRPATSKISMTLVHHEKYYFEDGSVVLKVCDALFDRGDRND